MSSRVNSSILLGNDEPQVLQLQYWQHRTLFNDSPYSFTTTIKTGVAAVRNSYGKVAWMKKGCLGKLRHGLARPWFLDIYTILPSAQASSKSIHQRLATGAYLA